MGMGEKESEMGLRDGHGRRTGGGEILESYPTSYRVDDGRRRGQAKGRGTPF